MADLACVYVLTTPGGTIRFNDGVLGHGSKDDLYWVLLPKGLDGPTLRVPFDDVPFGHGGLVHRTHKGPRHPRFEGSLIVQSVSQGLCQPVFNTMEAALNAALDSILAPTAGTLSWTPTGQAARSLSVYYEVELDVAPTDEYMLRSFNFGLISPAADPA